MARGYKTGGRKRGTPNKVTQEIRDGIASSGERPLEYMIRVMRDPDLGGYKTESGATGLRSMKWSAGCASL